MIRPEVQILNSIDWGGEPPCNPYLPDLYALSREWLQRTGMRVAEAELKRHEAMDIPYLAALTHPTASKENLVIAHNWLSWLFVYDDSLDEGIDGQDPLKIKRDRENFLSIMRGDPANLTDPLSIALDDIWRQVVVISDVSWRERFVQHTKCYLEAVEWEAQNRLNRSFPSEDEYLSQRLITGAVQPCFDLLIPTLDIDIVTDSLNDGRITHFEFLATEIIVLANDMISFRKEQFSNDLHNFVLIRCASLACEPAMVLPEVARRISQRVKEFRATSLEIAEGGYAPGCSEWSTYVKALETWFVGNYVWSLRCGRFS